VHPAIEEDSEAGSGAFRNAGNKARERRSVSAVEAAKRFSRHWAAILEFANGDQVSLVHGRSCLLMPAEWSGYG
jgi:hypothetical protein